MHRYAKPVAAAVAMVLAGASGAVLAEDAPAAGPKLSDILTNSGITATGYVAASFYHSSGFNTYHQFDVDHSTFQLDQAGLTVAYQPKEGFGALVDIIAGEDARIVNFAENGTNSTFNLKQAFVQYAGGPVTVIAGKYVTLAGAEVIAPTGNTNFSRSLLFFAEPLTHTGIRATFAATDTLSLIAGVNNGWNTTSTSYGSKTAELGIAFTPSKAFALTAQGYTGKTQVFSGSTLVGEGQKTLLDTVATLTVTDALSFIVSADWGRQEYNNNLPNQSWWGIAAYANYTINDQFRISGRLERLDDKDGYQTGFAQKIDEVTVTLGYMPEKSFEFRVEARYDKARDFNTAFIPSGPFVKDRNGAMDDHQTEIALQGIYKF